jgi:hypothetical protein
MGRLLRSALLITALSGTAVPPTLANAPWSPPARVPGSGGPLYDLWFPASGPGVLSAWCCAGFGAGSVAGTRLATSTPADTFGSWRTASRDISTREVAGSGVQRFAFGWMSGRTTEGVIGVVQVTRTGVSRPVRIFPPATASGELARLPDGHIAIVGQVSVQTKNRRTRRSIYLSVRRPGHGFSKAVKLAGRGDRAWLGVAVDARGDALAAWARNGAVFARERFASGRLSRTRRIAVDKHAAYLTFALARNGSAAVAWMNAPLSPANTPKSLRVALRPAGGDFQPARTLDAVPNAEPVRLGAYPDGRIQLAWIGHDVTGTVVRAAQASAARLSDAQTVSGPGAADLDLALGPFGDAALSWIEPARSGSGTLRAAVQPAGATGFAAPETVAVGAQCCISHLAIDRRTDRAVVAWEAPGPLPVPPVYTASREPIR